MEALRLRGSCVPSFQCSLIPTRNTWSIFKTQIPFSKIIQSRKREFKVLTAISPSSPSTVAPEEEMESEEKFDWYSQWYPVAAVFDLDKRRPHGRKVLGIDVVVWWDRNENAWKVFDDSCPHRLAPLSEGRIDQQGRLQCVYHGWCFGGAGECKFIPQAPRDGPPVHTSKRACVGAYPNCVQNGILWFWPNTDPHYKDIFLKKKPYYIPDLDNPSFTNMIITRDISYGYEVLIENLMDPAHVPYAHYGIMETAKTPDSVKADREGGSPLEISVTKLDKNGFTAKHIVGESHFVPPCLFYVPFNLEVLAPAPPKKKSSLVFLCVPVSPGKSRLIYAFPRNFGVWVERIFPPWMLHIGANLVLDSDLYLLHVEERKLKEAGSVNWHKACFVPTKSDAVVAAYRKWLNKYGGTQVDWRNKYTGELPPTPPREQLLDRYWTHTVICSSCNSAYKGLNALEVALQVMSVSSIAVVAAAKQGVISVAARYALVAMAVLCFVASKWLSHFIYKTFRYHDYDHAFH